MLDPASTDRVNAICAELRDNFGLRGVDAFPYPHISFCFLNGYTQATVEHRLHDTVSRFKPFIVKTAGIGIFLKPNPVLFISVVRGTALERLYRLINRVFPPLDGDAGFYTADHWMPHVTLAVGDLTTELLPDIIRLLSDREFHWDITLDNLAFASETDASFAVQCSCSFGG